MPPVPPDHANQGSGEMTASFDDAAIVRLRLAAEEVAWLTGRGYPLEQVGELVARHHELEAAQRAALARGTCSEPQYRRRAARELEAEDVAKRPLSIDAVDAVAAIEAALEGRPVLQTLDGTVRAFDVARAGFSPGPRADEALTLLFAAAKDLRASVLRFLIDEVAADAPALQSRIAACAKAQKAKVEVAVVPSAPKALRKERQIVTGDADVLDACAGWFNLVGRLVEAIPSARVVRLQ
jgi:hypothetical protein